MKKNLSCCVLDITSGHIVGILALVNRSGDIIDIEYQSGVSSGIKNGMIINLGVVAEQISAMINKLNTTGQSLKSIYTAVGGPSVFCRHSVGILPVSERANKVITSADISKVSEQAYSLGLNIDEVILHQIPQWYMVDNQNKVLHPEGLYGHRLETDQLLIGISTSGLKSLVSAIEQAGFHSGGVVLSGLATALAVLSQDAKEKGCCLLDLGYDSTQMLIFKDGILRNLELFSFGWNSLTDALALELKVPAELAEDIKISYGSGLSENIDPQQEVLIKKENIYRPIKRKTICLIIEKQLQEMFGKIKETLACCSKGQDLTEGIVVSGRIALLEGFLENLESNFNIPVRLANIEKSPLRDLNYATAIGLVRYAAASAPKFHPLKLPSYGNIFQKIIQKSREIYQEYF